MGYSEHYKKEEEKMNLGKKYKQLFEGKARSNDITLIKESNVKVTSHDEVFKRLTGSHDICFSFRSHTIHTIR